MLPGCCSCRIGVSSRKRRGADSGARAAARLIALRAEARRGIAVAALRLLAATHQAAVHGGVDGVVHLVVDLRELVGLVRRRVADITHCRRLDHVAHDKPLHGLVLGDELARQRAYDAAHLAAALLVAAVIAALDYHWYLCLGTVCAGKKEERRRV